MPSCYLQQNTRGSLGLASPLFPILEGISADTQHRSKFSLRKPIIGPNLLHIRFFNSKFPGRRLLTAEYSSPSCTLSNSSVNSSSFMDILSPQYVSVS